MGVSQTMLAHCPKRRRCEREHERGHGRNRFRTTSTVPPPHNAAPSLRTVAILGVLPAVLMLLFMTRRPSFEFMLMVGVFSSLAGLSFRVPYAALSAHLPAGQTTLFFPSHALRRPESMKRLKRCDTKRFSRKISRASKCH